MLLPTKWGGALRDDTKNGFVVGYWLPCFKSFRVNTVNMNSPNALPVIFFTSLITIVL